VSGPFNAKNATLAALLGVLIYIALIVGLRFLLRALPLELAALVTFAVILAYPAALVLGAVLSLRRYRRSRE
jgi:hypothetical protein